MPTASASPSTRRSMARGCMPCMRSSSAARQRPPPSPIRNSRARNSSPGTAERRIAMRIVQGDALHLVRGLDHRGGPFHYRNLPEGTPGAIDNFQLSMGRNDKDFVSPRHRHNFDQFRFQLEGDLDFARDGRMTPGMVGYFPEGASYGPQTSEATATTIVLQFGGASGSGYLSRKEVKQGMDELKAFGTFEGGVFRRNDGEPGKRN